MNRLMSSLAVIAAASFAQGCATTSQPTQRAAAAGQAGVVLGPTAGVGSNACAGPKPPQGTSPLPRLQCAAQVLQVAHRTEVPVEKDAPSVAGHPLTSVVVTQCNLIVAVYMTMADGTLLRFDSSASVPASK